MGNPAFAAPVIEAAHGLWGDPVGVYTAPDRRRGRGLGKGISDIKAISLDRCWPVFQPRSLKNEAAARQFEGLAPDVVVVAAYGLLIPKDMLGVPKHGFINIHPSLLPRYRGPSPVPAAILDGQETTGVSLMLLDAGMDTGPVLARRSTRIQPGERADGLTARLFRMGAELLTEFAPGWVEGRLQPQPQDASLATYTAKLAREDGLVDWRESASMIHRRFRAYTPWPGLYTFWGEKRLRLLDVDVREGDAAAETPVVGTKAESGGENRPGEAFASRAKGGAVGVWCGDGGRLLVRQLQLEGRRAQSAAEFLRGYPGLVGAQLG